VLEVLIGEVEKRERLVSGVVARIEGAFVGLIAQTGQEPLGVRQIPEPLGNVGAEPDGIPVPRRANPPFHAGCPPRLFMTGRAIGFPRGFSSVLL
jgi:hypothetical protein